MNKSKKKIIFIDTHDNLGTHLQVFYDGVQYLVEVSRNNIKKSKSVPCSFTPTFGMDLLDQNQCLVVAEELAQELDNELT